jgi:hypothetical protein
LEDVTEMQPFAGIAALSVGLSLLGSGAGAEVPQGDPLSVGSVVELSFGLFAPTNTLQDTLTTPNGGGAQVQSTDVLDFGQGGRLSVAYSQPWGSSRLMFSLTGAQSTGDAAIRIGSVSETFPGSFDDGFNLPAGWSVDTEVETRMTMLTLGRDWAAAGGWRFNAGLQGGTASQDFSGLLRAPDGELWRTLTTQSNNRMYGVFGGVSHYAAIRDGLGLRLSGSLGVMHNSFETTYTNVVNAVGVPPSGQRITASDSGTVLSTRLSARLERTLSDRSLLVFEIGYEGLDGVGNGVDTFLDEDGTATTARVDKDRIGAGYLSVGYAFRF